MTTEPRQQAADAADKAAANDQTLLASDIYVALVTTFAGLVVAIPAAIVAHSAASMTPRRARLIQIPRRTPASSRHIHSPRKYGCSTAATTSS